MTASVKNLLYQLSHGESCRNYMYSVHLEQNSSAVKINHEKKHPYGPNDLVHKNEWVMYSLHKEFCSASGHNNDAHGTIILCS